jgi:hypothetical protein
VRFHQCLATLAGAAALSVGLTVPAEAAPSAWTIVPSPNPTGVTSSSLAAVSCSSTTDCVAVGDSYVGNIPPQGVDGLAEGWDGSTWSLQPTPSTGAVGTELSSVSCAGPDWCVAVGYVVQAGGDVETLAEQWDGTSWTIVPTPTHAGVNWAVLTGVSCLAPQSCMAVGGLIANLVSGEEQPLAETLGPIGWSVVPTPNPQAENGSSLDNVACVAGNACEATGEYAYADVAEAIFAFGWDGHTWKGQHQPQPSGNELNTDGGISCPVAGRCLAVGSWAPLVVQSEPLAEVWDGESWTDQKVPSPSGRASAQLSDVSCNLQTGCVAVGSWSTSENGVPTDTLASLYNGSTWTDETPPNPPLSSEAQLDGIACPQPSQCFAVGGSYGTGGAYGAGTGLTLIEAYTG